MKNLSFWVQRGHMYLALFCLPWFLMYGITAIAYSHPQWFEKGNDLYNTSGPNWTKLNSWPCTLPNPSEARPPKSYATQLLEIAGIEANGYGAYRLGANRIEVYFLSFQTNRRLTYDLPNQTLTLFERKPFLHHTLTAMHSRAGYQHGGVLNTAWAFMVDLVAISFILWVFSGFYLWWKQRPLRLLGTTSLLLGLGSFVILLWLL